LEHHLGDGQASRMDAAPLAGGRDHADARRAHEDGCIRTAIAACNSCGSPGPVLDAAVMPARRFVLLALALGGGAALVLTDPLVRHPASTVLDDGTLDAYQFVWNLWWVRTSLVDLHTNPLFTRLLFYPDGISL